jgi:hypothetical protein
VKPSDLLDRPMTPGCLHDRSGPEWGSVDLRNSTPLGDLFDSLMEASEALPAPRRRSGRPPLSGNGDELRHDYTKARERWPGEKLKPLCRLMCKHFPGYRAMKPDALRKRISKMLMREEWVEQFRARGLIRKAEEVDSTVGDAVLGLTTAIRWHVKWVKMSAQREGKN